MTSRLLILFGFILCLSSFYNRTDKQKQIDEIFRSDTFCLTRTLHGSYQAVFDSIVFKKQADSINVFHYKHFPGPQSTTRLIDQNTLAEIKKLFTWTTRPVNKKCDGPFFVVYSSTKKVVLWDRRCGNELLSDIEKLTQTN